ncbi:MAG: hypothetical protein JXR05_07805 [Flavobacteriaceae bacterium]
MIKENKFSKYFLYAIGEIVLVVIGILIALQINNLNENRQKKKLERDYLSEIKGNLIKDTLNINITQDFTLSKIDTIANTLALFEKANFGEPYFNKLRPKLGVLTDFKMFSPVRTGFDNMVSSEKIGLINNKALRTELSNYYSDLSYENGTQERVKQVTREFTDDIAPKIMNKELLNSFINLNLDLKSSDDVNVHSDEITISRLFLMLQLSRVLYVELDDRKEIIKTIIVQIESQLK